MEEDVEKIERFILSSKKTFGEATELAFAWRRIKDRYRELEEKILELNKEMTDFNDCWIHIDKIRKKIEELEKRKQKYEEEKAIDVDYCYDINGYNNAIFVLQELMEDK